MIRESLLMKVNWDPISGSGLIMVCMYGPYGLLLPTMLFVVAKGFSNICDIVFGV